MKMLQGQLKETLFEWPDSKSHGDMLQKSQRTLQENKVAYINGKETRRLYLLDIYPPSLSVLLMLVQLCVYVCFGRSVKLVRHNVIQCVQ